MRYLRTDTEIYDIDDLHVCEELNGKPYATNDEGWVIYKESIVKEADTIEELCDEFVIAYESGARIVYGDLEWAETKAKSSLRIGNKSVIYGAIWTDKGLQFVARLNDKGELELL